MKIIWTRLAVVLAVVFFWAAMAYLTYWSVVVLLGGLIKWIGGK